ncbi:MAG: J domain-containing protein [Phycisphaerales bacterium]|nr:MAG: J domain-containing protein [Phycisphaerales bacterium]
MPRRDFYEILGLGRTASDTELRSAYRKLARQLHPDVNKSPDAQAKFTEVQEAYDVLSDPEKRRLYDRAGHAGVASGAGRGPGGGGSGSSVHFETSDLGDMGDLGSMFDAFFGGGRRGSSPFGSTGGASASHGARGGRARARSAARPKLRRELHVSFMTAILGGRESVRVENAGGERTVEVRVPAGVEDGKTLRVRLGDPAEGELLLTVRIGKHPLFRRIDDRPRDLELTLPLTIAEAVFGGIVTVPTPTGPVQLNVPPGTGSGRKLRLRGRGVGAAQGEAGDLYAVVRLEPPKPEDLTDPERDTLRAISDRMKHPRSGPDWGA